MTYRHSLLADGCMLLRIESAQGVEAMKQFAKARHFGIIIPGQTKGRIFRVLHNIVLPQSLHMSFALQKIMPLPPPLNAIQRSPSATLDELTREFKIIFILSNSI